MVSEKNILQNVLRGKMVAGETETSVDGHCLEAGDLLVEFVDATSSSRQKRQKSSFP